MRSKRVKFELSEGSLRLIEELRKAQLFSSLGAPISDRRVKRAGDWREAIKRCLSKRWYNARIDWDNELSVALDSNFQSEYQRWNDIANACRPMFDSIVEAAIERADTAFGVRKLARQQLFISVRVDLMGAIHEIEFEHLVPLKYYRSLLTWYLDGHTPCDCEGDPLNGKLVVF